MDGMEIEIFKPGTHTTMSGQTMTFGEADVRAIAEGYNPAIYEAPVVIGHPKTDAPAWGWVQSMNFADGTLKAVLHKVAPEFADMVKAGKFRNRSAALYQPTAAGNPTPGKPALKHLGFLGATAPAVKGLKPLDFADDAGADVFEFADQPGQSSEAAALRAELAALKAETRARDHAALVDDLVREGRLLPRETAGMMAFMDAVDGEGVDEVCFADGDGRTVNQVPLEFLKQFFRDRPKVVEYGEIAGGPMVEEDTRSRADQVRDWVEDQRAKGRAVTYADYPGQTR